MSCRARWWAASSSARRCCSSASSWLVRGGSPLVAAAICEGEEVPATGGNLHRFPPPHGGRGAGPSARRQTEGDASLLRQLLGHQAVRFGEQLLQGLQG